MRRSRRRWKSKKIKETHSNKIQLQFKLEIKFLKEQMRLFCWIMNTKEEEEDKKEDKLANNSATWRLFNNLIDMQCNFHIMLEFQMNFENGNSVSTCSSH